MNKNLIPSTLFALALVSLPFALQAEPLKVGDDAPDLKIKNHMGETVDLGDEFAEGVSLVYFYPKAMTKGCTVQACNLRDFRKELSDAGLKVFGASVDTVEDQKAFVEKEGLNFTLLADDEGKVAEAFGVLNDRGKANRQSFLVENGKVIWYQEKAIPATQAEDALAALKEIKGS